MQPLTLTPVPTTSTPTVDEDVLRDEINQSGYHDPFAHPVLPELYSTWVEKYHRWFPILHPPTFSRLLRSGPPVSSDRKLATSAIVVITMVHSTLLSLDSIQRTELQERLSDRTTIEVMHSASLDSLQAALILSVHHHGKGDFTRSWSLLAVGRRYRNTSYLTILTHFCNHCGFASGPHLLTEIVRDSERTYQGRRLQIESDCKCGCTWLCRSITDICQDRSPPQHRRSS